MLVVEVPLVVEFAVELVVGGLQFGRDGFGKLELESIFSGDTSIIGLAHKYFTSKMTLIL